MPRPNDRAERIALGPEFPGLDLRTESGVSEAMNTRREDGRMRGLPGPGEDTVWDGSGTITTGLTGTGSVAALAGSSVALEYVAGTGGAAGVWLVTLSVAYPSDVGHGGLGWEADLTPAPGSGLAHATGNWFGPSSGLFLDPETHPFTDLAPNTSYSLVLHRFAAEGIDATVTWEDTQTFAFTTGHADGSDGGTGGGGDGGTDTGDGTDPIAGDLRGMDFHTRADAEQTLLLAIGDAFLCDDGLDQDARSDPVRPLFWDGTPVTLSGSGYVVMAQNGPRTYFIETGIG